VRRLLLVDDSDIDTLIDAIGSVAAAWRESSRCVQDLRHCDPLAEYTAEEQRLAADFHNFEQRCIAIARDIARLRDRPDLHLHGADLLQIDAAIYEANRRHDDKRPNNAPVFAAASPEIRRFIRRQTVAAVKAISSAIRERRDMPTEAQ
jgi:hypothetical protein